MAFAAFWIIMASGMTERVPRSLGPWMLFPCSAFRSCSSVSGSLLGPLWVYLGARKTVYAVTENGR